MFKQLAEEFGRRGLDVVVMYPNPHLSRPILIGEVGSVTTVQFWSLNNKSYFKVWRLIAEMALPFFALVAHALSWQKTKGRQLITYSPTIFFGLFALLYKSTHSVQHILVLRDLFPQWLVDARLIRGSGLVFWFFRMFERFLYRSSDHIGLMSEGNIEVFNHLNASESEKAFNLPNWTSFSALITDEEIEKKCRRAVTPEDPLIVVYGGNIGKAQQLSSFLNLAEEMSSFKNIFFRMAGRGDAMQELLKEAADRGISNFQYVGELGAKDYINFINAADIGFISLSEDHTAHNFPGKILGYMEAGLPIIGFVNKGNDLCDLINQSASGCLRYHPQVSQVSSFLNDFIQNADERLRQSQNSRNLGISLFSVTNGSSSILELLGLNEDSYNK